MTRTPRLFLYAAAVTTATALAGIVSTPATTVASGATPLAHALLRHGAVQVDRGSDRMDALANTNEEWVAYKYDGGAQGAVHRPDAGRRGSTPAATRSGRSSAASFTRSWRR